MRFAKAEYIRALKDLRAADAELVRAEAAHELARARYVDAMTANLNADTEYQNLLNEYQQLINEARQDTNDYIAAKTASAIDRIKKEIELRELQHQKNIADAKKDLAYAEEQLRVALRNIALYSQSLTPEEQSALAAAVYMYETAFEETADQTMVVMQAQRTLDSLKLVREVGPDTAYDKSSKAYIGQVDKWKKDIETMQVEQALVAAILLAVPDSLVYDDVDGWKEQVDELVKDSTELAYNQYQVKTEMANYYTANIHDGVKVFNAMIEEFKDEYGATYPDYTDAQKKLIKEGEKTKDDFKKAPLVDSIKFAPFVKSKDISTETFNKFAYLLGSYRQPNPVDTCENKNAKHPFMDVIYNGANADTILFASPIRQKVGANMKEFIMGEPGNGEDSQIFKYGTSTIKANYGLWGAYDILERELVTAKKTAADTAKLREAMEDAADEWSTHRQILIDGVEAFVPFQLAEEALVIEEEENGQGASKMVQAIKDLKAAIAATHTEFDSFDGNDSAAFFKAILEFAQARESYLEFETSVEEIDPQVATKRDSSVFYYSKGKSGAGKAIPASKKFNELTEEELLAFEYELTPMDPGDVKKVTGDPDSVVNAYANIIAQMGEELYTIFDFTYHKLVQPTLDGTYPFATSLFGKYYIDSWAEPTKIYVKETGAIYEPTELKEAKADVVDAINEYIAAYNCFWNQAVAQADTAAGKTAAAELKAYFKAMDDGDDDKIEEARENLIEAIEAACPKTTLNPECYTLATFKPYADEAPIVYFTNGTTIDTTDAMKAILTAVDPAAATKRTDNTQWDGSTFETKSAIFSYTDATHATDFWFYMKAAYDYYLATSTKLVQDLAVVKAWIEGVEATFEADATVDDGTKGYTQWQKDYKAAQKAKAAYDEYDEALKEFTGVDEDGEALGIVGPLTDPSATTIPGQEFATIASVLMPQLVEPKDVFGDYPGEWAEELGGKQLEAAKTLFPEYPTEIMAWDEEIRETEDELLHYATLIQAAKKAYFAAAKIAGENVEDAANWDELVENYKAANKAYRERLIGIIEDLQADIETIEEAIAKFNQGLPQLDIAIAMAEKELKVETARLQGYEQALAYAKANLEHLLEYIKSLDVNFVVPAVDFDD